MNASSNTVVSRKSVFPMHWKEIERLKEVMQYRRESATQIANENEELFLPIVSHSPDSFAISGLGASKEHTPVLSRSVENQKSPQKS